ncbi:MAG: hypothetical protein M9947_09030 [Thermomicrobiales bacterium]|nr:hypothetical protein [Thermomicrobiales bacterium]
MTFFRREADRLDSYLDDQVAGRTIDPDDQRLDPTLIETWTWATTALAQTPSDPIAKSDTWRTIMQAQSAAAGLPAVAPNPPARRYNEPTAPRWSHRAMAFVGTAALAAGLAVGIVGYDRFSGGGVPNEPTSIPAASFFLPGTPEATGCDVPRREPGAIEKIMETPPSQTPYFPRINQNPLTDPLVGTSGSAGAVDGTSLWMNSSPDDSVQEDIQQALDMLHACRAFALDSQGRVDMEGPYFSLYSDDYFRRELNGFVQAGLDLQINSFWLPSAKPVVLELASCWTASKFGRNEPGGNGDTSRVLDGSR